MSAREAAVPNELLNPKSMITPGAAGGIIMLVTNTLYFAFGFEHVLTALLLSMLFGILVIAPYIAPIWHKSLLFVLNTLIVFSMAVGTMYVSAEAADRAARAKHQGAHLQDKNYHDAQFTEIGAETWSFRLANHSEQSGFVDYQKKRRFWELWDLIKRDRP